MNAVRMLGALLALALVAGSPARAGKLAVRGERVHLGTGETIEDGVVLCRDGKIWRVGPASRVRIPSGWPVVEAAVVTPGLIDAHSVVGLAGWLNYDHDQDQLERSAPVQPELRAIDAYDAREPLIDWIRSLGVTTVHSGHAPGALIAGQTLVAKTVGDTVEEAVIVPRAMVAATLGPSALRDGKESPGTRAKAAALLRAELVKARSYAKKRGGEKAPGRDLRLEALAKVLDGELPLLITAHRARDIMTAIRLSEEFGFELVLDGASEVYEVLDQVKAASVSVIVHPTMARSSGERQNLAMDTAARLQQAGIPVALQSGYESYVPKTRVVLFEAAIAWAYGREHGMTRDDALRLITIDAARLLGLEKRIGSIERGKDADLALFDGEPFEYTSHCLGTVIDGELHEQEPR